MPALTYTDIKSAAVIYGGLALVSAGIGLGVALYNAKTEITDNLKTIDAFSDGLAIKNNQLRAIAQKANRQLYAQLAFYETPGMPKKLADNLSVCVTEKFGERIVIRFNGFPNYEVIDYLKATKPASRAVMAQWVQRNGAGHYSALTVTGQAFDFYMQPFEAVRDVVPTSAMGVARRVQVLGNLRSCFDSLSPSIRANVIRPYASFRHSSPAAALIAATP